MKSHSPDLKMVLIFLVTKVFQKGTKLIGTLSKDDDDGGGRENVVKKMNLRSFELNRVYLDPLNMSNAGDFSWS